MNNSPYITELLINERLTALRSEGMRSQMLAREGLCPPEQQLVRAIFHRIQILVANFSRQIEQPATQKARANYHEGMHPRERTVDC